MTGNRLKYIVIFLLPICLVSSCVQDSLGLTKKTTGSSNKKSEGSEDINYPFMKYRSKVTLEGSEGGEDRGKHSFSENISIDVNETSIKISSKYNNDFKAEKSFSKTDDIKKSVEEKTTGSSIYTIKSNVSGSDYSDINSLFLFVSKANVDGKKVEFSKPVPFLPRDDVAINDFLELEDQDVDLSYQYKEDSNSTKISVHISVSDEDDYITIKLDNKVSEKDRAHEADFWGSAVFPKTSVYHMNKKSGRIMTFSSTTELIMSGSKEKNSVYYNVRNIGIQTVESKLCEYEIGENNKTFDCGN